MLVAIVPVYIFIPQLVLSQPGVKLHRPEVPLDALIPVVPVWAIIYGALYAFLILLPILTVRRLQHVRSAARAYLFVWVSAYTFFILYPTAAPRPPQFSGSSFTSQGLLFLYKSDVPFNCFPSLHVAHSLLSAFVVNGINRRVGAFCFVAAALVSISTLFTRQHYVLDVLAGVLLAWLAYWIFLRRFDESSAEADEHAAAPILAAVTCSVLTCATLALWAIHVVAPIIGAKLRY